MEMMSDVKMAERSGREVGEVGWGGEWEALACQETAALA